MTKLRMAAAAVTSACALLLIGGAGTAAAQDTTPAFGKIVPVTGEAKNGKQFVGTYTIKRFVHYDEQAFAVGTLRGELKNRSVVRRGVKMPVDIEALGETAQLPPLPIPTQPCTILRLRIGPIFLDLLGLQIRTNTIRLRIVAVPGPGNLLGNLLCAIANLLNPSAGTPLAQQVQVLNALLALAPRNAGAA
jgi:hypothetical protein